MTKKEVKPKEDEGIVVRPIRLETVDLELVGISPLICHNWSEKIKREMLEKQQKKPKRPKESRDPEAEYLSSLYPHPDGGYGFPSLAFKAAAVAACRFVDGIAMTEARGAFHVDGEMAKIIGEPRMREDMVRVGMGTADLRYRGEFPIWKAILQITYNRDALTLEQIVNLFNIAGYGVGVGEWRPEKKGGSYGRFKVATE